LKTFEVLKDIADSGTDVPGGKKTRAPKTRRHKFTFIVRAAKLYAPRNDLFFIFTA
jgi:hypothetical protein